jgi:hypothetical protein
MPGWLGNLNFLSSETIKGFQFFYKKGCHPRSHATPRVTSQSASHSTPPPTPLIPTSFEPNIPSQLSLQNLDDSPSFTSSSPSLAAAAAAAAASAAARCCNLAPARHCAWPQQQQAAGFGSSRVRCGAESWGKEAYRHDNIVHSAISCTHLFPLRPAVAPLPPPRHEPNFRAPRGNGARPHPLRHPFNEASGATTFRARFA